MKLRLQRELWLSLLLVGCLFTRALVLSADFVRGDANVDAATNVSDAPFVLGYLFSGSPARLACEDAADANDSGTVDIADPVYLLNFLFSGGSDIPPPLACGADPTADAIGCESFPVCPSASAASLVRTSPGRLERGVALTRETILYFSAPLDAPSLPERSDSTSDPIFARQGGRVLPARLQVSSDGRTVTLFYDDHLPASARVRVTIDGGAFLDATGAPVDVDANGTPGGLFTLDFDTITVTTLPGTAVVGRVFASELARTPGGEAMNTPLAGVVITVDGAEDVLRAVTDAMGNVRLDPAPVGGFFVHIDGRPVTGQFPDGDYYPFLGKPWMSVAGRETSAGDIFLPLIRAGSLQPVSATAETRISLPDAVVAEHPELEGAMLIVPPDSLYADDGARGGRVGIAPVPPDRVPGELPEGLEFPVVITVQTDGATNFDAPAGLCLPNLPDPATGERRPPGARDSLYSFSHDSGRWEAVGAVVVSEDGAMVCTEPGVGILAPGWHGVGPDPWGPPPPPTCEGDGGGGGSVAEACALYCGGGGLLCLAGFNLSAMTFATGCLLFVPAGPVFAACLVGALAASGMSTIGCVGGSAVCLKSCTSCAGSGGGGGLPFGMDEDPTVVEIGEVVQEALALLRPYVYGEEAVPAGVQDEVGALIARANEVAGGDAVEFLRSHMLEIEAALAAGERGLDGDPGSAPPYPVLYMAEILRSDGSVLRLRGETLAHGQYSLFVPRDGQVQYVSFYDRRENAWGIVHPRVSPDAPYRLPRFHLVPLDGTAPDFDSDGLPDAVEIVYGTKPGAPDTDGDGISDGAEVEQGTNPLDGLAAATGIVGTAATPVVARDVSAAGDLVVVAGLKKDAGGEAAGAVVGFNAFSGMEPRIIFQVDTPGTARAVSIAGDYIAVADGEAGLTILETATTDSRSIPMTGAEWGQFWTYPGPMVAQAVATTGGVAYVGTSTGFVVMVDLVSGMPLGFVMAARRGGVEDLAIEGDTLYAYTERELVVMYNPKELSIDPSVPWRVSLPGSVNRLVHGRGRLFVGDGIAYATHMQGYHTIGVGNPAYPGSPENPVLIAEGATAQRGWKQIVLNGSGLGVATVGPNSTTDGPHHVSLYDVSDPTQTDVFLTQFETPGIAQAVCIEGALTYVADDEGGLQVVNYLAYDASGIPPSVSLRTASGASSVEEGHDFTVSARVEDDVQVRGVALLVDGAVIRNDVSFPFDFAVRAPLRSQSDSIRIQARATDTGGTTGESEELVLTVTPDVTPPGVSRTWPPDGSTSPAGTVDRIAVRFTEAVMPATVTSGGVQVYRTGADGKIATDDDEMVVPAAVSYSEDTHLVVLDFTAPLSADEYRIVVRTTVSDLAGNHVVSESAYCIRQFFYEFVQTGDDLMSFVGEGEVDPSYLQGYSFSVNAGQELFFDEVSGGLSVSWYVSYYLPEVDDEVIVEWNTITDGADVGRVVFDRGGLYTMWITGDGAYRFRVWEVPPAEEFEIAVGDRVSDGVPAPGAGVIETPGAEDLYRFTVQAGARVYFDEQVGCCGFDWRCVDEDGAEVFATNSMSHPADVGTLTLERGGTYTITVSGHVDEVGAYGFQLWDVPPPDEVSINIRDRVSGEIETPGVVDIYTFTAAAGETVFFDEEARCCTITWRCVDEDGAEVFGPNPVSSPQDVGAVTLERGGEYTVIVSGFGDGTGPYGFEIRPGEE